MDDYTKLMCFLLLYCSFFCNSRKKNICVGGATGKNDYFCKVVFVRCTIKN